MKGVSLVRTVTAREATATEKKESHTERQEVVPWGSTKALWEVGRTMVGTDRNLYWRDINTTAGRGYTHAVLQGRLLKGWGGGEKNAFTHTR